MTDEPTDESPRETVYLVDTYASLFRHFHAYREALTNSRGEPTHAVRGMVSDLNHLLTKIQPDYLVYVFESDGRGERGRIDETYKANRGEMPDDLRSQVPKLLDVLAAHNIPCPAVDEWEADDVIATLTRKAVADGLDVRIVTNDKDARQLLQPGVEIYSIRKDRQGDREAAYYDEQALWDDWGVRPDQVIDFQAMVGDSVDNVPGIPKVGPKMAQALLDQFETLDEVLAHPELATGKGMGKKLRENLVEYADQARRCRQLVTLNQHLDVDLAWDDARIGPIDHERLLALYEDLGFRSDAAAQRRILDGGDVPTAGGGSSRPQGDSQGSLFGGAEDPPTRRWSLVNSPAVFSALVKKLERQDRLSVDLETTSTDPMRCEIVGYAIAWPKDQTKTATDERLQPNEAVYVPVRGPEGATVLDPDETLAALRPILEDPEARIDNQNIKYDAIVLARHGVHLANIGFDPMVGDYLLDAGARSHGFDELARRYFGHDAIKITDLIGKGKKQTTFDTVELTRAAEYATEDADYALRLADVIDARLQDEGLTDLYWTLERPLIEVLMEMERTGFRVDADELLRQSDEAEVELSHLTNEIHAAAGREFNADSPKQLAAVLFEELDLPIQKRTKTGPSTDQEVLEKLAAMHPLPRLIIEQRTLSKLRGTYLEALPKLIHPETGRIHASFNQTVTSTGRLSTSEPNLQNIPVRTEAGRRVRRAFIPGEDGWKLLCADYSQVELRVLAHFCGDEALVEAFRQGLDIHRAVAAETFAIELDEVTSDQRRIAKGVNFGVIYGQTSYGLSTALGISREEAQSFIDAYFTRYARVQEFIHTTLDRVLEVGYAETITGRRRPIEGVRPASKRHGSLNFPERTAFNAVIQGTAADLMKLAMLDIAGDLRDRTQPGTAKARMLLQVHDELIFECPAADVAPLAKLVQRRMAEAMPPEKQLSVPLVVDVKAGRNWLEAEPV